jgi:hypothetical protein
MVGLWAEDAGVLGYETATDWSQKGHNFVLLPFAFKQRLRPMSSCSDPRVSPGENILGDFPLDKIYTRRFRCWLCLHFPLMVVHRCHKVSEPHVHFSSPLEWLQYSIQKFIIIRHTTYVFHVAIEAYQIYAQYGNWIQICHFLNSINLIRARGLFDRPGIAYSKLKTWIYICTVVLN